MTTFAPSLRFTRPQDAPALLRRRANDRSDVAARRWMRWTIFAILLIHWFLLTAGHLVVWPQYTARTDLLARAFAHGQMHLLVQPDPRFAQLADPYDPVANAAYRQRPGVPDSCLYNGKLYLYWGPVPALLMVPVRAALGPDIVIGDQFPLLVFTTALLIITAALLLRLRSRHFPNAPAFVPALGVMIAGLSAPITCMITRAAVYEVAIAAGQFFLLTGIYFAWRGSDSPEQSESRAATRKAFLLAAGLSLALAVGCRVSLAVAVSLVAAMTILRVLIHRAKAGQPNWKSAVHTAMLIGLPMLAGAIALGWYNHARFGHWADFGQKYQLANANLRSYPSLFGFANLAPGLWSYFLRPVAVMEQFPFLMPISGEGTFPDFIHRLPYYESYEPITGLIWVFPVLWLLPLALVGGVFRAIRRRREPQPKLAADGRLVTPLEVQPRTGWVELALVLAALAAFAPVLLMMGSSQRYLADFTPALVIVATIWCLRWTHHTPVQDDLADDYPRRGRDPRRLAMAVFVSLAICTMGMGLLICVEGYSAHFRVNNRPLFDQLGPASAPPGLVSSSTSVPSASAK